MWVESWNSLEFFQHFICFRIPAKLDMKFKARP
jgi:hypothetical protein